ncbi:MAG: helicase-related protein, partial [Alphaproteobacteria bacterium]|nr:helicase-related protein [Alphaproteobacteria bacterium]
RPRLSVLSYGGRIKLTRLPRRTAIVAFSVDEVYAIAETVRQHRGGTAVVLGALSPATRNAQVAMYQAGEVDYLVATDAIGMGLNMDVDHVAFASMRKYDGHRLRPLRPWEIGQIAGRAGRHMNDGTFGVTNNLPDLDEDMVELVESHEFTPISQIMWRNRSLDYSSPAMLLRSLQRNPQTPSLLRMRDASDHQALKSLMQDEEIMMRATSRDRVQLLWDVCQVPDFRKISPEHHAEFIGRIYRNLTDAGEIPEDLIAERLKRLDNPQGEIDQLTQRLAHIRSWAYVAHRNSWLRHSWEWQEKAAKIEEKLSDSLHKSLMLRFVDKRAALMGRKSKGEREAISYLANDGSISMEGHMVGRMAGFRFQPDRAKDQREAKQLAAAAAKPIAQFIQDKASQLVASDDSRFRMNNLGRISWNIIEDSPKNRDKTTGKIATDYVEIARLSKGDAPLSPTIKLLPHNINDQQVLRKISDRLQQWSTGYLEKKLKALSFRDAGLSSAAKGLLFQISENLGSVSTKDAKEQIAGLTKADRKILAKANLRFGLHRVYFQSLLKADKIRLRFLLNAVFQGVEKLVFPSKGQELIRVRDFHDLAFEKGGYLQCGPVSLRHDHYEQVTAYLRNENKKGSLEKSERLADRIRCTLIELTEVMSSLGYREVAYNDAGMQKTIYQSRSSKNNGRRPSKPKSKGKSGNRSDKMGQNMIGSHQVTETIHQIATLETTSNVSKQSQRPKQNKGAERKTPNNNARRNKPSYNPDSPFAGLRDLLKGGADE